MSNISDCRDGHLMQTNESQNASMLTASTVSCWGDLAVGADQDRGASGAKSVKDAIERLQINRIRQEK